MRDVAVVIPAGGSGLRLGLRTPKQFVALAGAPILVVTVRHFMRHPRVGLVVVAAPATLVARTGRLLARHFGRAPLSGRSAVGRGGRARRLQVVAGGAERQDSVSHALNAVPALHEIVVVHDAVRPFITRDLVDRVLAAARAGGAAVCARPIAETIKRVHDGLVEATIDRSGLWAVQTPQAFRAALLREAHDKAGRDGIRGTDDAMLVERLGHPVRVVRGSADNVKITTREDLRRARAFIR